MAKINFNFEDFEDIPKIPSLSERPRSGFEIVRDSMISAIRTFEETARESEKDFPEISKKAQENAEYFKKELEKLEKKGSLI